MQPMSAFLLDQLVLSKPYFENQGIIVAVDGEQPVGYVHAGFGPNEEESALAFDLGVTCMLMVHNDYRRLGIGSELLSRSEEYLRSRGAKVLYAGGIRPLNPFYLGLYGGSELPGVLVSDANAQRLYSTSGYEEIDRTNIMHRELAGFRPPVDRQQIQIRRRTKVVAINDPPTATWWEACTFGGFDRTRFELHSNTGGPPLGAVTFWRIEPLGTSWGVQAVGMIDLEITEEYREQGMATALVSESMRQLQAEGFGLVEVQTMQHNSKAIALYEKLGFAQIDQGVVFRKRSAFQRTD